MSSDAPRLAVLIDADNTSPKVAGALFLEIAKLGEASVRRIYGDFSSDQLKGWSRILAQHAIIPHQQFAYTTGKNSSDIALVIDAMDLLHTGRFDGFCLVSSDSDFTRLASRIREQGVDVYGFGGRKTPVAFRQACKRFFYTENLAAGAEPLAAEGDAQALPDAAALVRKAMEDMTDDDGWVALGVVGQRLGNIAPDFDARSYGCSKLIEVIEKTGAFEIERQEGRAVRIREKPAGGRATGRRRGGRRAAARAEREEARRPSEARTPPRAEGDGGEMQPDEAAATPAAMAEPDAPAMAQQPPKAPKRRRARKSAEPDAPASTPEAAADAAPQSDAALGTPDKAAAEDKPAPADEAAEAAPKPRARRRTRKADAPKAEAAETGTAAAETAGAPGGGDGSEAEAAPKPRARRRARKDQAMEPDGADASATDASAAEAKAPEASATGTHAAEPTEPKTDAAEASAADAPAEAPKPRRRATRKRAAANAPEGPAPADEAPASDAKPARRSRAGAKAKPAEGWE